MKTSPITKPALGPASLFRRARPAIAPTIAFAFAIVAAVLLANLLVPTVSASVLTATDVATDDGFGRSVSASGSASGAGALVGAPGDDDNGENSGAAYYYQGLDAEDPQQGPVTETVKLLASDGAASDQLGYSVSLSGANALVGANNAEGKATDSGAAYYYKALDAVNANLANIPDYGKYSTHETVKLLASDGAYDDQLGTSVSLSGDNALVGAYRGDGKVTNSGAAYYYQGLNNVTEVSTNETVKLLASDGTEYSKFGTSVSLSGDNALVGAYYYKDLDEVIGNSTGLEALEGKKATYETVRLLASDDIWIDAGSSASLSGDNALVVRVTANPDNGVYIDAAYYYQGLDSVLGNLTDLTAFEGKNATYETVKLFPSEGLTGGYSNHPVSLDGDRFVMGGGQSIGKAWANDIRAFTTLDAGDVNGTDNGDGTGTTLATTGLSFVSRTDWIIGATTANNTVTLTAGDTADVTATDKAVYIGQTAGADNNTLILEGTLTATDVYVGAAGNEGNRLEIAATADWSAVGTLHIAAGNTVNTGSISPTTIHPTQTVEFTLGAAGENGTFTTDGILTFGGTLSLVAGDGFAASDGAGWDLFAAGTFDGAFDTLDFFDPGAEYEWQTDRLYTEGVVYLRTAPPVPEPATWAALAGLALLTMAAAVRHDRAAARG
ncbi:MAG: FG-GAP repeat protein [Opitutaceae bacterium]|jgi:hypothetical protein|nr:FG-GAP repeat protein [Opitutaceae bacterium]